MNKSKKFNLNISINVWGVSKYKVAGEYTYMESFVIEAIESICKALTSQFKTLNIKMEVTDEQ